MPIKDTLGMGQLCIFEDRTHGVCPVQTTHHQCHIPPAKNSPQHRIKIPPTTTQTARLSTDWHTVMPSPSPDGQRTLWGQPRQNSWGTMSDFLQQVFRNITKLCPILLLKPKEIIMAKKPPEKFKLGQMIVAIYIGWILLEALRLMLNQHQEGFYDSVHSTIDIAAVLLAVCDH